MGMSTPVAALLGVLLVGGLTMIVIGSASSTSCPQGNPQVCGQRWTTGSPDCPAAVACMV